MKKAGMLLALILLGLAPLAAASGLDNRDNFAKPPVGSSTIPPQDPNTLLMKSPSAAGPYSYTPQLQSEAPSLAPMRDRVRKDR